jgi:Ca2+-transporting ATPase
MNALVGFYREYLAERSLAALKSMLPSKARLWRDGISQQIDADKLVPGDVLLLEAGDRVAADGRPWLAAARRCWSRRLASILRWDNSRGTWQPLSK